MSDPFSKQPIDPSDRGDEPEIVQGEVVDDATAGPFEGRSPFDEPDPFAGTGTAAFGTAFAGGGVGGAFGALRAMAGNSPEVRELVTTPLRLLAIAVVVPSAIALLFGLTIDGSARYVGFGIAVLGGIAALLLELRRRKLVAVPPPQRAGDPVRQGGAGHLIGLIGFAVLMLMLAIGFDLLALLLVIFGVW